MNPKSPVKGLRFIASATILFVLLSFLYKGHSQKAAAWLLGWTGVQSMAAFSGFVWSMTRSSKIFYSIFVGDALLRLVVLAVAVGVLYQTRTPFTFPLLSLAMGYLVLSLIQIPFLHRSSR
ncbi:MAG: hypothetical protein WC859_02625 [Elusimicrobiota bacterium]|jgi:hypothetical protein